MPSFRSTRRVRHSAMNMFALVANIEAYPQFVPLCRELRVVRREAHQDGETVEARMAIAYKLFSESFTTRVELQPAAGTILVHYLDGPFRRLENRWTFKPVDDGTCEVSFFLDYDFKTKALQLLMGAVFDRAFSRFAQAFEARADLVYGKKVAATVTG